MSVMRVLNLNSNLCSFGGAKVPHPAPKVQNGTMSLVWSPVLAIVSDPRHSGTGSALVQCAMLRPVSHGVEVTFFAGMCLP